MTQTQTRAREAQRVPGGEDRETPCTQAGGPGWHWACETLWPPTRALKLEIYRPTWLAPQNLLLLSACAAGWRRGAGLQQSRRL